MDKVFHLILDQPVSRRKRFHYVANADGEIIWTGNKSSEAWSFLRLQEAKTVHIRASDGTVVVQVDAYLPW